MLNEKENELKSLQLEFSEVTNIAHSLKKEVNDKDEALDTATAHINSLEENKKMLESKLNEYTTSLRSIIKEKGAKKRKESDSDDTTKEIELKGIIKEKNKALKSSETAQKVLANKLSEIENKVNPYGICYDWQNHGARFKGDICRNRHHIEMAAHRTQNSDHFLGHCSPSGANRAPEERKSKPSQRSPGQTRHHDQRGGRW